MSAGRTEKPPRIKGLVKRCRSFKEDIISRLARNKSLSKEDGQSTSRRTHTCSSEGTSPTPGASDSSPTTASHSPQVTLSHRLKEAYLTLQFVESLIRKNCIDLVGGSSNVMLDLMGSLLSDVRKTAVSDSPTYQCVISQIKLVLSEFLVAVDTLLLKNRLDEPHRELCYQKLLETLTNIRAALDRLKGLLSSKENGHGQSNSSSYLLLSDSPAISVTTLKSPSSTGRLDSLAFDSAQPTSLRKPPLPPKLKQWAGKSFDMEYITSEYQPSLPIPFTRTESGGDSRMLNEWLEKTAVAGSNGGSPGQQRYSSQPQFLTQSGQLHKKEECSGEKWTDSAVYLSRSSKGSTGGTPNQLLDDIGFHNDRIRKLRTMSDSFYGGSGRGDSVESLDRIMVPGCEDDLVSQTTTSHSHCSQSLSLGSSLDNLLLVDSHSQHSGLSPNSGHRVSTSSTNNQSTSPHSPAGKSGQGLASLSSYDPDQDPDGDVFTSEKDDVPPELPKKMRQFVLGPSETSTNGRCPSPYDNVDDIRSELATWHGEIQSRAGTFQQQRQFMSYSESRSTLVGFGAGNGTDYPEDRPPLPPKKKHSITAYVELLHNFDSSSAHHQHFINHQAITNHVASAYHNQLISKNRHYPPPGASTVTLYNPQLPGIPGVTPASQNLNSRASYSNSTATSYQHFSSFSSTATYVAPTTSSDEDLLRTDLPEVSNQYRPIPNNPTSSFDSTGGPNSGSGTNSSSSLVQALSQAPPALPPKKSAMLKASKSEHDEILSCEASFPNVSRSPAKVVSSPTHSLPALGITSGAVETLESPRVIDDDNPDLYLLDVSSRLVHNDSQTPGKGGTDGPEVKGGDPHILMVYAASPDLTDLKFWEVFLLTYRTFVRPLDLVTLLWKRFEYFEKKADRISMIHRRATLELFVDVICSLTPMDLEEDMITKVRNCIYHLVNGGEIHSALKSRKGLLDKYEARIKLLGPKPVPATLAVTTEPQPLLRWSAASIAQQMTLLDAELFRQLEPAELLLWAREQQEDFCPALNNFTDHFNKVSYWARSKVLLCPTARERNRTMKKMIEVMRKLREYSNFNSLLAVLAALDSAPIRRLGFSRRLTEALKPHAALTDSSGSFRTYRQALSESKPPCIPYIGLVLQDLTFVHIGNADSLADGKVNWLKRWQQWLVLEPIRRFHACHYGFLRNDSLLSFLNNFDESLNDDDLWQMSESIKPRGKS